MTLAAKRKTTHVTCGICGWRGTQADCSFGHDDFYCPKCGKESLTAVPAGRCMNQPVPSKFCPRCGVAFAIHEGDGACPVADDEKADVADDLATPQVIGKSV
jgi:RNA polymerase subunit RPABC4/transcription elongation factor Spt4